MIAMPSRSPRARAGDHPATSQNDIPHMPPRAGDHDDVRAGVSRTVFVSVSREE
ncbi:hypothetical protein ACFQ07_13900 [Actinomadura adrarensis]|uniref:Uncharacterized protein n=1 Tax=Actinomadura adrarensis TaxID=1819600 RepID=A0ABW3CHA3_9ACTN